MAWLALESGAPVVPVALSGTDRIQPVGRRLPRLNRMSRVTVRFGEPMTLLGANTNRVRRAVTDEIMAAIQRLSGQQQASAYAQLAPPVRS